MALTHRRRCAWCADRLTEKQSRFCSRLCVRGAYVAGAARAGATPWKDYDYQPHGTLAAWRRHYRLGEKPCYSCRQADVRARSERRAS